MQVNLKRRIVGRANQLAIIFSLVCCLAHGEPTGLFLHEVAPDFWETNLVATVVGYSYINHRSFLGEYLPVIVSHEGAEDLWRGNKEEVWLYSLAPTNYAGMLFRFHSCDPSSVREFYPTNQLFVFQAATNVNRDVVLMTSPIVFSPSNGNSYCPYRTPEKWFPIDDNAVQGWTSHLNERTESDHKQIAWLRETLATTDDEKKRSSRLRNIKEIEDGIRARQRKIDELVKQSRYFEDRIKWLESQGLEPRPSTDEDNKKD